MPEGGLKQPVAQLNQPSERVAHTRITEYPRAEEDPCYPIPRAENRELYKRYRAMAARLPGVTFAGRLASYQYLNMDQVTAQALAPSTGCWRAAGWRSRRRECLER